MKMYSKHRRTARGRCSALAGLALAVAIATPAAAQDLDHVHNQVRPILQHLIRQWC